MVLLKSDPALLTDLANDVARNGNFSRIKYSQDHIYVRYHAATSHVKFRIYWPHKGLRGNVIFSYIKMFPIYYVQRLLFVRLQYFYPASYLRQYNTIFTFRKHCFISTYTPCFPSTLRVKFSCCTFEHYFIPVFTVMYCSTHSLPGVPF